jgi:hypothetical protein
MGIMVATRRLGYHSVSKREVHMLILDTLATPNKLPDIEGRYFACFCALDAKRLPAGELGEFCSRLLQDGCAYLCAWGPGCARVHDIMDEQIVGDNPPDSCVGRVMTTWHAEESLPDALSFFLNSTQPDESYAPEGCEVALIISLAASDWNAAIEQYASDEMASAQC